MRGVTRMLMLMLVLLTAIPAIGEIDLDYYLPTGVKFDPAVPPPEDYFGFQVGERHLRHEAGYLGHVESLDTQNGLSQFQYIRIII